MSQEIDDVLNSAPDTELILDETKDEKVEPYVEYRTGAAGTGKTFSVKMQIEQDPKWALLCATTGIAAVNLNTVTLHSALGLHPDSIYDQFTSGYMRQRMHTIAKSYRNLGIDEMSMLRGDLLDMLYTTAEQVNEYKDVQGAFGLILIGDLCQLPPIKEKSESSLPWVFKAECWPKFDAATTTMTKNWRQGNGLFLDALNHLRSGRSGDAGGALAAAGVSFVRSLDPNFDGTVILGRNLEVDNYNKTRYWRLKGIAQEFRSHRWGKESGGWHNIPETLTLKEDALVMILANDTERDEMGQPMFRWVNGDTGHVRGFQHGIQVELIRTGALVTINSIERRTQQKTAPDGFTDDEIDDAKAGRCRLSDRTFYDPKKGFWVRGAIEYVPLRLAYATTVHKSQGLTLDRIQVDLRHSFLGKPAMTYVAASRCRTADGLHIVGDAKMIERRCKIDEAVRRWL